MSVPLMDNTGNSPLQVPGFGSIPLSHSLPPTSPHFRTGIDNFKSVVPIAAREIAMLAAMNRITDIPNWHIDIFNDEILATWQAEEMSDALHPLMSQRAWEWCVVELCDKAGEFERKGFVRVLDTGSGVWKSDGGMSEMSSGVLRGYVERWGCARWMHGEGEERERMTEVVDMLKMPLVFGRSKVLVKGGRCDRARPFGISNSSTSRSMAEIAPQLDDPRKGAADLAILARLGRTQDYWYRAPNQWPAPRELYHFSYKYQCLPCEVEFRSRNDGSSGGVRIASYVNDLHPQHGDVYSALEEMISQAIPLWNECLIQSQPDPPFEKEIDQRQGGTSPMRILTYGVRWQPEFFPQWALPFWTYYKYLLRDYHESKERLIPASEGSGTSLALAPARRLRRMTHFDDLADLDEYPGFEHLEPLPEPTRYNWDRAKEYLKPLDSRLLRMFSRAYNKIDKPRPGRPDVLTPILDKFARESRYFHPEPADVRRYDEWKSGSYVHVEVGMNTRHHSLSRDGYKITAKSQPQFQQYQTPTCLEESFREKGLQVMVNISSIDLAPGEDAYAGGAWMMEDTKNEHIVASAIYVFDCENVSGGTIAFRQEANVRHEGLFQLDPNRAARSRERPGEGQGEHRWTGRTCDEENDAAQEIWGWSDMKSREGLMPYGGAYPRSLQSLGRVKLQCGRMVAFPNVMEYRVEELRRKDETRMGRVRYVTLHLVDPHYRICSTRNVPAQEFEWWAMEVGEVLSGRGLPQELVDRVMGYCQADWHFPADEKGRRTMKEHVVEDRSVATLARQCSMRFLDNIQERADWWLMYHHWEGRRT